MNYMTAIKADYSDCPKVLRDYLFYLQTIKGRSSRTVDGYYIDLRTFFRFLNLYYGCLLYTSILILIMFLFNVSFHELTSIPFLILKLAAILLCSILGGILGVNKKSRRMHP